MRTTRPSATVRGLGLVGASLLLVALAPATIFAQDGSAAPAESAAAAPAESAAPAASPATSQEGGIVTPYTGAVEGSGVGKTIGYMSLGEYIPFVNLVTQGIQEEATKAGVNLIFCDTNTDPAATLACAQQMKTAGAEGVINFQITQAQSPEFCAAYDNVPTIAIDIIQPPCEKVFFGADNFEAGRRAGLGIGEWVKENWDCEYDAYVSLESVGAGAANAARMGGMRAGFEESCPIINENIRPDDDRTNKALDGMSQLLPTLPGERIVVTAINEDGILGAMGAAATLGRQDDLVYAGQGADPSIWKDIACNPQYISSSAYFPERYGQSVVPAMIDLLDGKEVPRTMYVDHVTVTKDNIRELYPETPPCD
jgi:ribose transport system substrate-binding protein